MPEGPFSQIRAIYNYIYEKNHPIKNLSSLIVKFSNVQAKNYSK